MKKVTVTDQPATVYSGVVELSPEQARHRMHALRVLSKEDGRYAVMAPINFKRGEVFGYDGDIGKDGSLRSVKAEAVLQDDPDSSSAVAKTASPAKGWKKPTA